MDRPSTLAHYYAALHDSEGVAANDRLCQKPIKKIESLCIEDERGTHCFAWLPKSDGFDLFKSTTNASPGLNRFEFTAPGWRYGVALLDWDDGKTLWWTSIGCRAIAESHRISSGTPFQAS